MKPLIIIKGSIIGLVATFFCGVNMAQADTLFTDDFNRENSPQVGNEWVEVHESTTTITLSSGNKVFPGFTEIDNNSLGFHYIAPDNRSDFINRPYIYNQLPINYKPKLLSFNFRPNKNERVLHDIALVQNSAGFIILGAPDKPQVSIPDSGIAIRIARTSYSHTNSTFSLIQYKGGILVELGKVITDFQFDFGNTYYIEMELLSSTTVRTLISNGIIIHEQIVTIEPINYTLDTLAVMDIQGGVGFNAYGSGEEYILRFDDLKVTGNPPKPTWIDISKTFSSKHSWGAYKPHTGIRYATVHLESLTTMDINQSLRLLIDDIVAPDVFITNNTGTTTAGTPYITLDKSLFNCTYTGIPSLTPNDLPRNITLRLKRGQTLSGETCTQLKASHPSITKHLVYRNSPNKPLQIPIAFTTQSRKVIGENSTHITENKHPQFTIKIEQEKLK